MCNFSYLEDNKYVHHLSVLHQCKLQLIKNNWVLQRLQKYVA